MRKTLCALLVMGMIFAGFAGMASANTSETISVTINGEKQTYSVSPILRNNSVLVPLRAIFESLGSYLTYDPETQEITASKGNTQIYLQVGNNIAKVNDQTVKLDQPAIVLSGSTYVPVRFVSEALGAKVDWDPKTRTVIIEYVDIYMIDAALREDNLDKFAALIKRSGDPALGNDAISLALNHQKGVPWISAALEAGAPVVGKDNMFAEAITQKRADVVKFLLDEGYVDPSIGTPEETSPSAFMRGFSYIGLAYRGSIQYLRDANGQLLATIQAEPSFEIAEMLYGKGFRATTLDAYYSLAQRQTDWFDWMLGHGADPDGEIPKLVYGDEKGIYFYTVSDLPEPETREKLIQSAYTLADKLTTPETMQNLETLIVKYGASLDPLTQAQKDRLLQLARFMERPILADALIKAGAKE